MRELAQRPTLAQSLVKDVDAVMSGLRSLLAKNPAVSRQAVVVHAWAFAAEVLHGFSVRIACQARVVVERCVARAIV